MEDFYGQEGGGIKKLLEKKQGLVQASHLPLGKDKGL